MQFVADPLGKLLVDCLEVLSGLLDLEDLLCAVGLGGGRREVHRGDFLVDFDRDGGDRLDLLLRSKGEEEDGEKKKG